MNWWVVVPTVIFGGANAVAVGPACGGDRASAGATSMSGSLDALAPELRAKLEAELRAKLTPEIEAALRPKLAAEIRRELEDRMHADRTLASARPHPPDPHAADPGPATTRPPDPTTAATPATAGSNGTPDTTGGDPAKPGTPDTLDTASQDIWSRTGVHIWPITGSVRLLELAVGTGLEDKSPHDVREVYEKVPELLYCYTAFESGQPEQTVTHVWRRGNRLVSRVELEVGQSPKWKTWSKQRTQPHWTGLWSCEVLGPDGTQLGLTVFRIGG